MPKPLQPYTHHMKLDDPWFELLANGIKRFEIRLYDNKRKQLQKNDLVQFNHSEEDRWYRKKIKSIEVFNDFRSAIEKAKIENVLPGTDTIEQAVSIYHSIPTYKEQEHEHGVVLIGFYKGLNRCIYKYGMVKR